MTNNQGEAPPHSISPSDRDETLILTSQFKRVSPPDDKNGKPNYDRAFCIRMKSTLTKRGCHFKVQYQLNIYSIVPPTPPTPYTHQHVLGQGPFEGAILGEHGCKSS